MKSRIRSIKPEIHTDEKLWDLEMETGLPVFRAFVGLINYCDREGRFEWRPRGLKGLILPFWDGDFARVLDALASRELVVRYIVDDREYGVIRTFAKHQVVNNREGKSGLPPPPLTVTSLSPTRASCVSDASATPGEGKGREGNEREGKGNLSSALRDLFVALWEARHASTPVVSAKHWDQLVGAVEGTARIKTADPAALFEQTLRVYLERGQTSFELGNPVFGFASAWSVLTSGQPLPPEGERQRTWLGRAQTQFEQRAQEQRAPAQAQHIPTDPDDFR